MDYKVFDILPEESKCIRYTVFIEEQGFETEIDEYDADNKAKHILLYKNGKAIATARAFEEDKDIYHIGRVAVLKEERGNGFGRVILENFEKELKKINAKKITISAQLHAKGFYESLGYTIMGDVYLEEGKEHIWCEKAL